MAKLIRSKRLFAILTVLVMVLAACGSASTESTAAGTAQELDALTVVATTTIWGDIVSNVTGDAANLEVLYPVGADPHDHELSSSQVALMQEADLVVVNGLLLEEGILDVIEGLESDGVNVLEVAPALDPILFGASSHADHEEETVSTGQCDPNVSHEVAGDHEEGEGDGEEEEGEHEEEEGEHEEEDGDAHGEGSCDPHVWMDPLRIAAAVELIAEELAELDPTVDWIANASAYADELRSLDAEIISTLDGIAEGARKLVTNHEALGYFADRYDFEVVGAVIPSGSTLADPSSAELAELVETMTHEGIDVIFAENIEPSVLADAVAAEVGEDVEVVTLFTDSLGGPGSGGETYVDMLRFNANLVATALS